MDFELEQHFVLDIADVEDGLTDPGFLVTLDDLTTIGEPAVLETKRSASEVHQQVRYRFVADLPGAVTRVVDPDKLTWIEDARYDLDTHTSSHQILPDSYADRLEARFDGELVSDGEGARRLVRGTVKVHVPLVAGKVERVIVDGLRDFGAEQAERLNAWFRAQT